MMTRLLVATCALTLYVGCGGKADRHTPAHAGSAGQSNVAGSGAAGGSGHGGNGVAGGDRAGGGGSAGGARGGATNAGSGGSASGSAGRGNAGSGAAGSGGASGSAGTSGGGGNDTGAAGAAGDGEPRCGGLAGATCPAFEYCDYDGDCHAPDASGVCRSASTQSCGGERVCGCDGKVYAMACRAYSEGVDITESSSCVAGDGEQGDPCVVDDDCLGDLKCCSSPIAVVSCTAPMGGNCPLTP